MERQRTPGTRRVAEAAAWLFVPGDRAEGWLATAIDAAPDVVILDLEDAVLPARKAEARDIVRAAVIQARPTTPIAVRINGLPTSWWADDVELAVAIGALAIVLPKTADADDVERLGAAVATARAGSSPTGPAPAIVPLVETASGVLHAEGIAAAPGVVAVGLGGVDLAADLGILGDAGPAVQHARAHLALACAAAGCAAIDAPVLDPRDVETVTREAAAARGLGFSGKLAIHPAQVPAILAAFRPTDDEVRWASSVIDAADAAERAGSGVAMVDGRMIDAPLVTTARRILGRVRLDTHEPDR